MFFTIVRLLLLTRYILNTMSKRINVIVHERCFTFASNMRITSISKSIFINYNLQIYLFKLHVVIKKIIQVKILRLPFQFMAFKSFL